jgi:hypothetical protein
MKKYFNINGLIIPDEHYYAPIDENIKQIFEMIQRKEYFVINKPRQYGKTTTISFLKNFLNSSNDYLCISISFEGISQETWSNEKNFCEAFLIEIYQVMQYKKEDKLLKFIKENLDISKLIRLSLFITELNKISKKIN